MIAEALGQRDQARGELSAALQINPHFHLIYAGVAQKQLAVLEAQSESSGGAHSHAL
jgi:hypothetical protein